MDTLYKNLDTDCVVFDCICRVDGGPEKFCKYGIEFEYGDISETQWRGKPAHTMVYKTAIAKKHQFCDLGYAEDIEWVKRACLDIKIQTRIDKVLYYYDAQTSTTSETRNLSDEVIKRNILNLLNKNS